MTRRTVFLSVLVGGLALISAPFLLAQALDSPPEFQAQTEGGPAEERYSDAPGRLQAARLDAAAEKVRVDTAQRAFAQSLSKHGSTPQDYVVSFAVPIRADALLPALPGKGVLLKQLFSWFQTDPKSIYVSTGFDEASALDWNPDQADLAAKRLDARYLDRLAKNRENLVLATQGRRGHLNTKRPEAQLAAIDDKIGAIRKNGVMLYGIRCLCSPESLTQLETSGLVKIRVVEVPTGDRDRPLDPFDPLRDLIIASGGRYGR